MSPVYQPAQAMPPMAWPTAPAATWTPRQTPVAAAPATTPRPIVRLQAPEELLPPARPAAVVLPPPEALGVKSAQTPAAVLDLPVDWNVTHDRLNRLGAIRLVLAKLEGGSCRFAFELPTTEPGRMHHIEAEAASEGAAVCRALDLADHWVAQRQ
jgi:hypothetical protein